MREKTIFAEKFFVLDNQFSMVAKTLAGLEDVLAFELKDLGAHNIKVMNRAVGFDGNNEMMYKANYCLRTALRILKPVSTFKASNDKQLYDKVNAIHWHEIMDIADTFAIDAFVSGRCFNHSQYAALRVKDAIADEFRTFMGARPSVDTENPNLRINVHIVDDLVTMSFDSSGDSLHKRGYRKSVDKAPINEVLAAGLIKLSRWDSKGNFVDCMCGSGTIPIEAAMYAMNIPAGYYRTKFGFMDWSDFDQRLWDRVKAEADDQIIDSDCQIFASDHSPKAVAIAKANITNAHLTHDIELSKQDMFNLVAPEGGGMVLINPPYGERLEEKDIAALYKGIGDALKKNFNGYTAWIISSDITALKLIGLKPSCKIDLYNGPLACKFVKFDVFAGTYRDKKIAEKR